MLNVADLFAGAGGFSKGFIEAGFNIAIANEIDSEIAKTYQLNHANTVMVNDDIKNLVDKINEIVNKNNIPKIDIIIGGPPCQGFSMAGARIRSGFIDDPRNYLFKHYFNVVRIVRPKIFILENVKGILTLHEGKIFNEIKKLFEDAEIFDGVPYKIQYKIVKAKEYGVPQNRERVILIGSQIDFNLDEEIDKTKKEIILKNKNFFKSVTVWDAISNLSLPTEDGMVEIIRHETEYQRNMVSKNKKTWNHKKTNHSKKAMERIQKIKINQNYIVLDEKIKSVHSGAYGRMDPNGIAPTITTRFDTPSGGKFIHPYENRTITPREAARLQSFSDDFNFVGSKTSICKQIGNAVPPKLAYFFAIMIRRLLEND